jgi:glycosyltransferase involved in cell wall biosynthesis
MRVLHVTSTLGVGGAEAVVTRLVQHLRALGEEAEVCSLFGPLGTPLEAELLGAGIPVHFLEKRPGVDLRTVPRLRSVLRRTAPDVVHTHTNVLHYLLPALGLRRRCPVVHTVHNVAEREVSRPTRAVHWVAFRTGVFPIAIGQAVADSIAREYRVPAHATIANGIPVARYAVDSSSARSVREAMGVGEDVPLLATVGRLTYQKDPGALVRAFAGKRLEELGAHLMLVGDGDLRSETERLARELGVSGRVHFMGVRTDVPALLAAADVFVLSSRYEGNPLVVMEAMAAGRPVVATSVGCVPELVPPEAGRLVPAGDGAALYRALIALAGDRELARRMGAAGARIARERFDEAVMAAAYARLYASVARGGNATSSYGPGN